MAQQRLETAERGQGVEFVDLAEQRGDRPAAHDPIGMTPRRCGGDRAFAMAGHHVGMRLVDDESVRVGGTHARQEIEIAANVAAGKPHRKVVLDLARHQDAAPSRRPRDARLSGAKPMIGEVVFGDAAGGEPVDQPPCPGQQLRLESAVAQQAFKIAFPARVEIDARPVEDNREPRQKIGAEPDRTKKTVLDADHRDLS
jgi:hypothetical protein